MNNFRNKYGYSRVSDSLFKDNVYVISNDTGNTNHLKSALDSFNGADIKLLKAVSSIYDIAEPSERETEIRKKLVQMYGTSYESWRINGTQTPTLKQIKNYKEYSEFKTSKFKVSRNPEYNNGQIQNLYFKFVK